MTTTSPRRRGEAVRADAESCRRPDPVDTKRNRQEWRTRQCGACVRRTPLGVKPRQRPGDFACPNPTGHPSQADDEGLRMTAQNHVPSAVSRTGAVSALALAALTGTLVAPGAAPEAQAAGPAYATKALNVAASKKGSPYKYGAAGLPVRLLGPHAVRVQAGRKDPPAHRAAAVQPHAPHLGLRPPEGRPGLLPLRRPGLPRRRLRREQPDLARPEGGHRGEAGADLDRQGPLWPRPLTPVRPAVRDGGPPAGRPAPGTEPRRPAAPGPPAGAR